MAGYSLRKDQLWYFALQLVEEETKSIQFAQQEEEHGHIIHRKYNQLVSNLSCLGDIIATMYQEEKLTLKELEHIQHLQSTPIRANEELLSIIARKPRDAYGCFVALIKHTNQLHLYQLLASGDDGYDETDGEDDMDHRDLICRNFVWLSEKLDTENGLVPLLYQEHVLTAREREYIFCMNDTFQKNEFLLGLLSKKSPKDFDKFLSALKGSGQGHLVTKLNKPPKDSSVDGAKEQTSKCVCKKLPKSLPKFGQKPIRGNSISKPVPPPKPGTQSARVKCYHKAMNIVDKNTEKTVHFRKIRWTNFQGRLNGLESQLQTEVAIKVTSVHLFYLDKPEDHLKMFFDIVLQECYKVKKETVTRNCEAKVEAEQLKKDASQYSAVASLNEIIRTQLHSMQQEMTSERSRNNEERIQLEEKIIKLKTDIHNEKAKCRRFEEEKLLNNTIVMEIETRLKTAESENSGLQQQAHELKARLASTKYELKKTKEAFEESKSEIIMLRTERDELQKACEVLKNSVIVEIEDRLKTAEFDKQCLQQEIHEVNSRLASTEYELLKSKETIKEGKKELIMLRNERDELKKACEILKNDNEIRNELEVQVLQKQENNQKLLRQLEEIERNLELAEEEKLDLIKTQKESAEAKTLVCDRILKLQEELDSEKHQREELEGKLDYATTQARELDSLLERVKIAAVTHESLVIKSNHQFLVENLDSNRLIAVLHSNNCITDEELERLSNQPYSFCKNDELLHWMRTISFKEDKGLRILECFRQAGQNFVVDLLEKGGVLIKSEISTKLMKERLPINFFTKSTSEKLAKLKEKEAVVIEKLNQAQGFSLPSSENSGSKMTDDQIVIVPYCRQDDTGIVIWFWCQSKNAQRELQSMYASGSLLGELVSIFEQFSNGSVLDSSEVLIPISVTIFLDDFTKYEKKVDFKTDPKLLLTIRTKAAERIHARIEGLAVLANEIFVVTRKNSEVEVYNKTSLQFERSFIVDNLEEPGDIASCSWNKCLYILDEKPFDQPLELLKVDECGNILKKLWQCNDSGRLSVTDDSNIILSVLVARKLLEITSDGQLVREIPLDVLNLWHAVKLSGDRFVVTYGEASGGRVCIINNKGKVLVSPSYKDLSTSMSCLLPINVVANRGGSFLVVDETGGRILLLTSTLEFLRKFLSRRHGLGSPRKIFIDELNCRLLVCDNSINGGHVLVYDISR